MTPATTVSAIITDIGSVFTGILDWIPDVINTIFGNAFLTTVILLPIAVGLVMVGIKFVKSISGKRKI